MNWSRIGRMDYVEVYVRRMLANTMVLESRVVSRNGELPWDRLPEAGGDSAEPPWPLASGSRSPGRWGACPRRPHGSGR